MLNDDASFDMAGLGLFKPPLADIGRLPQHVRKSVPYTDLGRESTLGYSTLTSVGQMLPEHAIPKANGQASEREIWDKNQQQ